MHLFSESSDLARALTGVYRSAAIDVPRDRAGPEQGKTIG